MEKEKSKIKRFPLYHKSFVTSKMHFENKGFFKLYFWAFYAFIFDSTVEE